MNARDLLLTHKRALETCIAANAAHKGDTATTLVLDALTHSAKRYLGAINRDLGRIVEGRYGTAGKWGENGFAPAIASIIKDSELQRNMFAADVEEGFYVEAAE